MLPHPVAKCEKTKNKKFFFTQKVLIFVPLQNFFRSSFVRKNSMNSHVKISITYYNFLFN